MNTVREIEQLNKRELEDGVSPDASWHADYRDTAYIYIGGLSFDLTEGDIITVFSQFGEPVYVNLIRDKESGKSKGFAFLKYEDQRSTDLAVDNLGGATVLGRVLKVDHTRYKRKDGEEELEREQALLQEKAVENESEGEDDEEKRPLLKEEEELDALIHNHDDDDPMKVYLVKEKKEELAIALAKLKKKSRNPGDRKKKHRHRHHHRSRSRRRNDPAGSEEEGRERKHERPHKRSSRSPTRTRIRSP